MILKVSLGRRSEEEKNVKGIGLKVFEADLPCHIFFY
jgi:hypothetical protein